MACRICNSATSLWCLGCEQVQYCGKPCQREDWTNHHKSCGGKKLVGAGAFEEGFIPLYPEESFWLTVEGKTLDDVLMSFKHRSDGDISVLISFLMRPFNWGRVFGLFQIQRPEARYRIREFVFKYGGTDSANALNAQGIEIHPADAMTAIRHDNTVILRYMLGHPHADDYLGHMLMQAVESNSVGSVDVLLHDARTNSRAVNFALVDMKAETSPRIVNMLVNDDRANVKQAVEIHVENGSVEIVRLLLGNLQSPTKVPRPYINKWLRTFSPSPQMREVLQRYADQE